MKRMLINEIVNEVAPDIEGLTAEQQALVDKAIEDSKKGLLTEEDVTRRVTAEVDRRVQSGIEKGVATQRAKWEEEYAAKAKMSAEELAKKEFDDKLNEMSKKELEIQKRANKIDAIDALNEAGIPKAHYNKFIGSLVSDSSEVTTANVQGFIAMYNETKGAIETEVKKTLSNVPAPNAGSGDVEITKDVFRKMSYAEKLNLKNTNIELYKKLIK